MHKVWLADDDEAIRIVLEESLKDAGFNIRTFETATDPVSYTHLTLPTTPYV